MGAPVNNRNAAKAKDWETAIRKAIAQHTEKDVLRKIAQKLVDKALEGEQFAITEIGNRLDGKPAQSIDLSGSLETREAVEMTDAELQRIATSSSSGVASKTASSKRLN